jgi:hypothetical protein
MKHWVGNLYFDSLYVKTPFSFLRLCGITNLACNKLMMKIVQSSFIHRFVHFIYEYHALKTCLTHDKCVDE